MWYWMKTSVQRNMQSECARMIPVSYTHLLRAITQYAAWQYHEEDQKGTLEAGKLADFAVLDQNPLEIPVEEIRNIQVLETWKEGTCIYKRQVQESQNI